MFPLYVLIGDEQTFRKASTDDSLQWFERMEVEDDPHWCWDLQGNKYKLIWDTKTRRIAPELVLKDDRRGFKEAVLAFVRRVAGLKPARHFMTPDVLVNEVRDIMGG